MKFFTKKSIMQKIIIVLIALILVNFVLAPSRTYAAGFVGKLLKEIVQMVASLGDIIMGALNNFMVGAGGGIAGLGSALLEADDANLTNSESWLYADESEPADITFGNDNALNTNFFSGFKGKDFSIPNMIYSPENIFANKIPALDVNFLKPNTYTSVKTGNDVKVSSVDDVKSLDKDERKAVSSALTLQSTISSWYKSFRNIAIVGLLSVLIYLGIRILLSSTAVDKAKYKESLKDWLVALCLVFFINFIMSGILMITQACNELFTAKTDDIVVEVTQDSKPGDFPGKFRTNLMGLIRLQAQSDDASKAVTYTILYVVLIIYTIIFTVIYFKRFLYMAFFTMIAPLVALTYPIDKAGDGQAQAFHMWFKEYTLNAVIQPVHLILYSVFVGSATDLVEQNPIYALVAIGFLIPAEKLIKKMFKLDKAETQGGFGSFAGGALTMSALNKLASGGSSGKNKKSDSGKSESSDEAENGNHIFQRTNKGKLESFQGENNGESADVDRGEYNNENQQIESGSNRNYNEDSEDDSEGRENLQQVGDQQRITGNNPNDDADGQDEENEQTDGNGEANNPLLTSKPNNPEQENSQISDKPQRQKGWARRLGKRAVIAGKHTLKNNSGKAARFVLKAAGAGMGATIGLAAGIASGDMSKAFTYAGAGVVAGRAIGNKAQHLGSGVINGVKNIGTGARDKVNTVKRAGREEMYGYEYAQTKAIQSQNALARKQFLKDDKEIAKARNLMADMNYNGNVNDVMNAIADYKEAGITDDKLIHNALKAENKHNPNTNFKGEKHRDFVDVAAFANANNIGKTDITDDKKRKALETAVENNISGEGNRSQVLGYVADIFDARNAYDQKGYYGKTQMEARQNAARTQTSTSTPTPTPTPAQQTPTPTPTPAQQTPTAPAQGTPRGARTTNQSNTTTRRNGRNQNN